MNILIFFSLSNPVLLLISLNQRIPQPLGVRLYDTGTKYQGHFNNTVRDGFGTLYDVEKKGN